MVRCGIGGSTHCQQGKAGTPFAKWVFSPFRETTMRWVELLALADRTPAAERGAVLESALALLHEASDIPVHTSVVFSEPTLRLLCQALDQCGMGVSDDVAQELGIVSLGVECAWLGDCPTRAGAA
jgi:hypothetical protein